MHVCDCVCMCTHIVCVHVGWVCEYTWLTYWTDVCGDKPERLQKCLYLCAKA